MTLPELLLLSALVIAAHMLVFWAISVPLKNVTVVDIGWGLGFALVAWVTWLMVGMPTAPRALLLVALPSIWALRLSIYLGWRTAGKPEDSRYASMRDKIGEKFWWVSLFTVFLLQGVLMWVVALPLVVGISLSEAHPAIDWVAGVGIGLWAIGLMFEAGGDWQLARFKSKPENKGRVLDQGFWRYTRHPNYFGDFCIWWGHWLVAFTTVAYVWTIVSPITMSILLMAVSGVRLTEKTISNRRPEYTSYKRRTSAFFPWPPKRATRS